MRKGYMIHLNASDDRGIDIIRNQISQFVNTKSLFLYGGHGSIYRTSIYMWKTQPLFGYGLKGFRFKCSSFSGTCGKLCTLQNCR